MHRLLSFLLGLGSAANGIWMIASPATWYPAIPGVRETGPLNPHFVRDIGCAFLVAAIGFGWIAFARARSHAWPAAMVSASFLVLHALVHVWDLMVGREHAHHLFPDDVIAIFFPAALALGLAWSAVPKRVSLPSASTSASARRRAPRGILARLVEPSLASFEKEFDYNTTYVRDVVRVSSGGFLRFLLFSVFANHREDTPTDAWFATKLVAAKREDCGPCTQLVVRMAERAAKPVSAKTLKAIIEGDENAMSADASLAYRFANAVLDRDLVRADSLRREIVEAWGERALVTLSFTIASSRVYPTMKYALGHGRACSRVIVGKDNVDMSAPVATS